ncbi:hypothetical protein OF001_U390009 [Pseudomonas sp. OF001]|nr:hypothetical protein OF001_U390009 [Pseudomonas sp. OF001]
MHHRREAVPHRQHAELRPSFPPASSVGVTGLVDPGAQENPRQAIFALFLYLPGKQHLIRGRVMTQQAASLSAHGLRLASSQSPAGASMHAAVLEFRILWLALRGLLDCRLRGLAPLNSENSATEYSPEALFLSNP